MAETFTNARITDLALAGETVYTVPVDKTAVIIGFKIANNHTVAVSVDGTLSGTSFMGNDTVIPTNSALEILEGSKMVLTTGQNIALTPNVDAVVDVVLSIMEIDT